MVTKKPKGLGRGLDALLGPTAPAIDPAANPAGTPMLLALDEMGPGQYQPRTRMDEGALYELAESIKAQGIMQPILVRRLSGSNAAPTQDGQAQAAINSGIHPKTARHSAPMAARSLASVSGATWRGCSSSRARCWAWRRLR